MIKREVFAQRRKKLMELMGDESIAIWIAPPARRRNADSFYRYRPDSDILYLTGLEDPSTAVVIRSDGEDKFILFVRPKNPQVEVWEGVRMSPEEAKEYFMADRVESIEEFEKILPELMLGCKRVYYHFGLDKSSDQIVIDALNRVKVQRRQGKVTPWEVRETELLMSELRLYKDPWEIELIRRAAEITAVAHRKAMAATHPGVYEYQLAALIEYIFKNNGAFEPAYLSIVGGGERGAILHYIENKNRLEDGELVLIDAGAEYQYYAADITRTFPVNGKFSPQQRELYELVLAAQTEALKNCKPGVSILKIHEIAVRELTKGLVELGILKGKVEELIASEAYKPFYMHRTGHWLGLDVHDIGGYYSPSGEERLLEPGMVLTVEPGLYFHPQFCEEESAKPFLGIGIRIEDNVLITENGAEILTGGAPKAPKELEELIGTEPELIEKFVI